MIVKPPPCIESVCLVYAMCKHKKIIKCDKLVDYYQYLSDKVFNANNNDYFGYVVWDHISKYLPAVSRIQSEEYGSGSGFTFINYKHY